MCPRCEAEFDIPTAEEIDAALPDRLPIYPDGWKHEQSESAPTAAAPPAARGVGSTAELEPPSEDAVEAEEAHDDMDLDFDPAEELAEAEDAFEAPPAPEPVADDMIELDFYEERSDSVETAEDRGAEDAIEASEADEGQLEAVEAEGPAGEMDLLDLDGDEPHEAEELDLGELEDSGETVSLDDDELEELPSASGIEEIPSGAGLEEVGAASSEVVAANPEASEDDVFDDADLDLPEFADALPSDPDMDPVDVEQIPGHAEAEDDGPFGAPPTPQEQEAIELGSGQQVALAPEMFEDQMVDLYEEAFEAEFLDSQETRALQEEDFETDEEMLISDGETSEEEADAAPPSTSVPTNAEVFELDDSLGLDDTGAHGLLRAEDEELGRELAQLSPSELAGHAQNAAADGEVEKGKQLLDQGLEQFNESGDLLLVRGKLRAQSGDREGAIDDFLQARQLGAEDTFSLEVIDQFELDLLLDEVQLFIDEAPLRAAGLLRGIVAERPDYAKARYYLGKALLQHGDPESADKEFEKAKQLGWPIDQLPPFDEEIERLTREVDDDPTEALEALEEFLQRCPESVKARELIAEGLRSLERPREALAKLYEARKQGEVSNQAERVLYELLVELDRHDEAAHELAAQLEKERPDPFWVRLQADLLMGAGQTTEAFGQLCRLAQIASHDRVVIEYVNLMVGQFPRQAAISVVGRLLESDSQNLGLQFVLADLLLQSRAYPEAVELYNRLLAKQPQNRSVRMKRSLCLMLGSDPDPGKALADLRQAFR